MYKGLGRPTTYHPDFCQLYLNHCSSGLSLESFAAHIDVDPTTIYEWGKKHPDFSLALKKGKALAENTLMKVGLNGITGKTKGFAQGAWVFWMKARFGWSEDGPDEPLEENELEFQYD